MALVDPHQSTFAWEAWVKQKGDGSGFCFLLRLSRPHLLSALDVIFPPPW